MVEVAFVARRTLYSKRNDPIEVLVCVLHFWVHQPGMANHQFLVHIWSKQVEEHIPWPMQPFWRYHDFYVYHRSECGRSFGLCRFCNPCPLELRARPRCLWNRVEPYGLGRGPGFSDRMNFAPTQSGTRRVHYLDEICFPLNSLIILSTAFPRLSITNFVLSVCGNVDQSASCARVNDCRLLGDGWPATKRFPILW